MPDDLSPPSPSPVDLDAAEKLVDEAVGSTLFDHFARGIPIRGDAVDCIRSLVSAVRSQSRGIEELQGRLIEAIGRAERAEAERDAAREALSRAEAERDVFFDAVELLRDEIKDLYNAACFNPETAPREMVDGFPALVAGACDAALRETADVGKLIHRSYTDQSAASLEREDRS